MAPGPRQNSRDTIWIRSVIEASHSPNVVLGAESLGESSTCLASNCVCGNADVRCCPYAAEHPNAKLVAEDAAVAFSE
eukprot:8644460-Pyramimonas_sp.AAC.1